MGGGGGLGGAEGSGGVIVSLLCLCLDQPWPHVHWFIQCEWQVPH